MLIVWQSEGIEKVEKIFVDLKALTREKKYEIYGGIKRSRQLCTTTSYSVDCWQFGSLTFYYNLVPVRTWKLKIDARSPFRRSSKCAEIPVTSLGSLTALEKIKNNLYLFEDNSCIVWMNLPSSSYNSNNLGSTQSYCRPSAVNI